MNFKLWLLLIIFLYSCESGRDKFHYETSIASKAYESQVKYLDHTLKSYARISGKGNDYYQKSLYLDEFSKQLKADIRKGKAIVPHQMEELYAHFEQEFETNDLIDLTIFKQLTKLPVKTISDVDILCVYIKNNLVCLLLNNKLLPYNAWSTMASTNNHTIENGDDFEVALANIAWNSAQPNDWFLVKDETKELTKENIVDTLHQDEAGIAYFKTKDYRRGKNTLTFISRLVTPASPDQKLSRQVVFFVK